ncbi:hypothetical protein [Staphylococcus phage PT94]
MRNSNFPAEFFDFLFHEKLGKIFEKFPHGFFKSLFHEKIRFYLEKNLTLT